MQVPRRGFTVAVAGVAVVAAATACSGSSGQHPAAAPSSPASASSGPPAVSPSDPVAAGRSSTPLIVPAPERGGALSTAHTLTVPAGWTARVWARVPGARMEAWTPEGDLLVSAPGDGKIVELRPGAAATATVKTLLTGLTSPLGMTFLEGSKIAAPWSGGAVIAGHGSWNRQPPRAPAVLWLAWNAAKGTLEPAVTMISGFENPDGSYWGRPVDAVPGPDGALYVSDDTAGAIYRLAPPA